MKIAPSSSSPADIAAFRYSRTGIFVMIISVVCFTSNTLVLKYLGTSRSVDPSVALLFRAMIGALVVIIFFNRRRPLQIRPIFRDRGLILRGITGIIGTVAYYMTVPTLGPGKATLICNTYVLFAAIIASFVIAEKLNRGQIFWMVLAFAGIVLLVNARNNPGTLVRPPGVDEVIGLIGALAAASTVVLIRRLVDRFSNGTIFMTQCLWVGIAVFPFAITRMGNLEIRDVLLLSLGGVMAGFGQVMMNEGFRRLTVATGASIQMTWPVMTALGGFFLFNELFTNSQIIGAILIIFGIWRVASR